MSGKPDVHIGQRLGRWTVIGELKQGNDWCWKALCLCDCGTERVVRIKSMLAGESRSCGCYHREAAADANRRHGGCTTRLYRAWKNMRTRCESPKNKHYQNYGGRGIFVCAEWQDFAAFQDWALSSGYDDSLTIERIDNDGNYEPHNCCWVTLAEQHLNKRTNHLLTAFGETKTITEWARDRRCSVKYNTIITRLNHGASPENAVALPAYHNEAWS